MSLTELRAGGIGKLMRKGQRLLRRDEDGGSGDNPRSRKGLDRRSGPRVSLPLSVVLEDGDLRRAVRVRDVNLPGLSVTPAQGTQVGERVVLGFDGYPEVCPAFELVGLVRRVVPPARPGEPSSLGIEIDRRSTPQDAQKNYRRLVLHYLRHRPLLEDMSQGYFEGRCPSCGWVGRVGRRRPMCSRCGSKVAPVS